MHLINVDAMLPEPVGKGSQLLFIFAPQTHRAAVNGLPNLCGAGRGGRTAVAMEIKAAVALRPEGAAVGAILRRKPKGRPIGARAMTAENMNPDFMPAALVGADYPGLRIRAEVTEGDVVEAGQVLFRDRRRSDIAFVAPIRGRVSEIRYGPRRMMSEVAIEPLADLAARVEEIEAHASTNVAQRRERAELAAQIIREGAITWARDR